MYSYPELIMYVVFAKNCRKNAMDLENLVVFILIYCDSKVRPIKLIPAASII